MSEDQFRKQLEEWYWSSSGGARRKGNRVDRYLDQVNDLEDPLRSVGRRLLGLDNRNQSRWDRAEVEPEFVAFDELSPPDRLKLFRVFFPNMAEWIEWAWQYLAGMPYSEFWFDLKPYRAPSEPVLSLSKRTEWLESLVDIAAVFRDDVIEPVWLAAWTPHLPRKHRDESAIGRLLGAIVARWGDPIADEVYRILVASLHNSHEIGRMGEHVLVGLAVSPRPEGWEELERLLLAAQRQEGLRQGVLSAVADGHAGALARILACIAEHKLARFSSVVQAIQRWTSLAIHALQPGLVRRLIDLVARCLQDKEARQATLHSSSALEVYAALWCHAVEDAVRAIPVAEGLLARKEPEVRFAATYLLKNLDLLAVDEALSKAIYDEDPLVAVQGLVGLATCQQRAEQESASKWSNWDPELTDHVERLRDRLRRELPKKADGLDPLWEYAARDADWADWPLAYCLRLAPVERLAAAFPTLVPDARVKLVKLLADRARHERPIRQFLLQALADRSSSVQETAAEVLAEVSFTREELAGVERLLARRGKVVRMRLLELIARQEDSIVLDCARRLLDGNVQQQLAGVELLDLLASAGRSAARCRELLESYVAKQDKRPGRGRRRKAPSKGGASSDDPRARAVESLDRLIVGPVRQGLGADMDPSTAFGLLKGEPVTRPLPPRRRRVALATDAAAAVLRSLDELVHKHREERVIIYREESLLGERVSFPFPWSKLSPEENEARYFPLSEVWKSWAKDPQRPRDPDGLEVLRALFWYRLCSFFPSWVASAIVGEGKIPHLEYGGIVHSILVWLLYLNPAPNRAALALDLCEALLAAALELSEQRKSQGGFEGVDRSSCSDRDSRIDLIKAAVRWIKEFVVPERVRADKRQLERAWRLIRWAEDTFADKERFSYDVRHELFGTLKRAYAAGVATDGDWYEHLLGKQHTESWRGSYDQLEWMTKYLPTDPELAQYIARVPQVGPVLDRCRERILEIELARGEHPSPATNAALSLRSLVGVHTLLRILRSLGNARLKLDSSVRGTRGHSFAHLLHVTYPADGETPEAVAEQLRDVVKKEGLPEQRLVELGLIAPQWARAVEKALQWPGYTSAAMWILFHAYSPPGRGACLHLLPAGQKLAPDGDDERDALLGQYSRFTARQFLKGTVDPDWFYRVQEELGPNRWSRLLTAAETFTTPQRVARIRLISDVLLGKTDRDRLIRDVREKKRRLAVQLLGLLPLRRGRERKKDLMERYRALAEYREYARKLSPMSRPDAMAVASAGLENLARVAGYPDALRMEWDLGAAEAKRLLTAKRTVRKRDVVIRMEIDQACRPSITVQRGKNTLRALPKELKKDPEVLALYERAGELKEWSSRTRRALENMMCRVDEFSAEELRKLMQHRIVGPLLAKLVLVGEGIMGYPEHGGRALRGHDGKLEPVKPGETLRIAHPVDFWQSGDWSAWQHECFLAERVQPFKQIFRELYVVTEQEKLDGTVSRRYAGHQVQPRQATALWAGRDWATPGPDFFPIISKQFPAHDLYAFVEIEEGITTPLEVEGWLIEGVRFYRRSTEEPLPLVEVPPIIFSEVMRDLDLVVSVAHVGGVEPEASASTVEMRARLVLETCQLLGLTNVEIKKNRAFIEGVIGRYTVHLGSGVVHKVPGGAVCLVPVPSQHRGRLFLPFADDDPKTAEIVSKVLLLARDDQIQDPILLEQLRD